MIIENAWQFWGFIAGIMAVGAVFLGAAWKGTKWLAPLVSRWLAKRSERKTILKRLDVSVHQASPKINKEELRYAIEETVEKKIREWP